MIMNDNVLIDGLQSMREMRCRLDVDIVSKISSIVSKISNIVSKIQTSSHLYSPKNFGVFVFARLVVTVEFRCFSLSA